MSQGKRGQASTEYIMIIGIILVLLIPLFWYAWHRTSNDVKENQVTDCVQSLAQGADEVYSLSPGSKKYITCNVPGSVDSWGVQNKEINMKLSTSGDHVAVTQGDVIGGTLPTAQGTYRIPVELLNSGIVQIGEGTGNDGLPPKITWTWPSGNTCNPVVLRANTDEAASCKYYQSISPTDLIPDADPGYAGMTLKMEGTGLGHFVELGALATGYYEYWVSCVDSYGNAMNPPVYPSSLITFTVQFAECGGSLGPPAPLNFEENPPNVTLYSPRGTVTPPPGPQQINFNDNIPFTYSVNDDESNVILCDLMINNLWGKDVWNRYDSDSHPIENQVRTMHANLDRGLYNWTVNCTDNWGNTGTNHSDSVTQFIFEVTTFRDTDAPVVTLNKPPPPPPPVYPGGYIPSPIMQFDYNATDRLYGNSGIDYCILNVTTYAWPVDSSDSKDCLEDNWPLPDGKLDNPNDPDNPNIKSTRILDSPVEDGINQSLAAYLGRGCHYWSVYCYDGSSSHNKGVSVYRWINLSINTIPKAGGGLSCATYCESLGYSGSSNGGQQGVCKSNNQQCKNSGGVDNWGDLANELCRSANGNSEYSDTCCCYP